jgi:hypothetical protein
MGLDARDLDQVVAVLDRQPIVEVAQRRLAERQDASNQL